MVTALPIVEAHPTQDCGRCRSMRTCWAPQLSPRAVAVNLLTCRVTRGIDREKSTRTLLLALNPKVQQVARGMRRKLGGTRADYTAEIQSVAIESLLDRYIMGERSHPIRWLFGWPNGAISRWRKKLLRRHALEGRYFVQDDELELTAPEPAARPAESARAEDILAALDDGVSLSALEYRVLAFCLANAHDDAHNVMSAMDGLHIALAQRMSISRENVSRIYGTALRRLLDASGYASTYLRARGLALPRSASERRRRRFTHHGEPNALTADEVLEMLRLRREQRVSYPELAWIYGVTDRFARQLLNRLASASEADVRRLLRQ